MTTINYYELEQYAESRMSDFAREKAEIKLIAEAKQGGKPSKAVKRVTRAITGMIHTVSTLYKTHTPPTPVPATRKTQTSEHFAV